ncbi:hypothetical protein B0H16DRAFT_1827657 [Mycena metata]|uniref:Apple domain-containing protein n=1 Tax=Mycena metata TaxID=1033252 RepID=A0AAD7J326_9AGAR|nr:hypothetical protein B0H16DRAFT_1827657 [Mycena metata]
MRFSTFSAFVLVATGVSAANFSTETIATAAALNPGNYYGAPTPPWNAGHTPGWYYGNGNAPLGIFSILDSVFCGLLEFLPFFHCPKAPYSSPPYTRAFYNLDCGCEDGSYLTYGLVEVVEDCQAMCDSISGCIFYNTYHDVYAKGYQQYTCTLYKKVLTVSSAKYCGGQHQSDGSINHITNSEGYYKTSPTA